MVNYDNFSETFASSRKDMKWPEVEYFMDFIKSNTEISNPAIIDIGCGSGRLLSYLQQDIKSYSYLGIDSSSGMISEAIKAYPEENFKVLDMSRLSELDSKYDFVFLIASFHHIENAKDRLLILSELKEILNDGGYMFLTNWNLLSDDNFKKFEDSYLGNGDFNIKIGKYDRYYHAFKTDELNRLYLASGYEIIENRIFDSERNIISILKIGL